MARTTAAPLSRRRRRERLAPRIGLPRPDRKEGVGIVDQHHAYVRCFADGTAFGGDAVDGVVPWPESGGCASNRSKIDACWRALSGYVYDDSANNAGLKQAGDPGIAGGRCEPHRLDDLGQWVSLSATTNAQGAYGFANLRAGLYKLKENQPPGYLDGKDDDRDGGRNGRRRPVLAHLPRGGGQRHGLQLRRVEARKPLRLRLG